MGRKKKEEALVPKGTDNEQALEIVKSAIEKQYGKGTVIQGQEGFAQVKTISSGCISLNRALGGGWAQGRMIEIFGPEASGKTTLTLHAIAEVQKQGDMAAFIDAEHAFDPSYAAALGVDMDKLIFSQPNSAEQALEIVEMLVRSGAVKLIVIDSVAALVPMKELEGDMGDSNMGVHARLMSQAMRKLAGVTSQTQTTVMWINQIRMKIGVMFGSPETVTGGNALKFYSSQRVDVRRTGGIKEGEEVVASTTRAKVVKNKIAPPFREANFQLRFGEGIDTLTDLIEVAVDADILKKSGSWYSYDGNQIGQGTKQVKEYLQTNSGILEEVKAKLC
jgi:recombination protein RecA